MKKGFGIWYEGGGFDNGWLHYEGRHAHSYRCEYDTLEEAQAAAERESIYDKETVFYPAPLDSDHETLFKTVRRIFNQGRLERARKEVDRAEAALDDSPDPRPTAFDRLLDEDP